MEDKIVGIYTITNSLNGKVYVGYSKNIKKRFQYHRLDLLSNNHCNPLLQNLVNKYGIEILSFEVLEECQKEFLCSQEHYWATLLNVHNRNFGYNLLPTNPITGVSRQSNESYEKGTRTRRENALKRGYWHSEETRAKMKGNTGFSKMTKEQRAYAIQKSIEATSVRIFSKEEIQRRVNTRKNNGEKWHSKETLEKLRKPKTVPFNSTLKRIEHWYSLTKQILKYDKNMNLLEEFPSMTSAAKSIGSYQGTLGAVCKHNSTPNLKRFRTLKGFIWMIK